MDSKNDKRAFAFYFSMAAGLGLVAPMIILLLNY